MKFDNAADDYSQGSGAGFFTGLFAGALIGTGLGILFAPRRGAELRGQVAESAANASQTLSTTVDNWSQRGRDVVDQARDFASRAGEVVDRAAGEASKAVDKVKTSVDKVKSSVDKVKNGASDIAAAATRQFDEHVVAGRG